MLRFRLKELLAEKQFQEGRLITMTEVGEATGIHRLTLSKIANRRGYVARTDSLDSLCSYFNCRIEELVVHLPDEAVKDPVPIEPGGRKSKKALRTKR